MKRLKKGLEHVAGEEAAYAIYRSAIELEHLRHSNEQEKEIVRSHCIDMMACLELGKKSLTPDEAAYAEIKQNNLMRMYKEMLK